MLPRPLTLASAVLLALGAGPRRDLEVGIPPGPPLEWARAFPSITPPRRPLFPVTGEEDEQAAADRSRSVVPDAAQLELRAAGSFTLVRILTWDLTAHLDWIAPKKSPPRSGRSGLRPPPPRYGDPLFWVGLAPLLRLLLHPETVSRTETVAHLVELGDPMLAVLEVAAGESALRRAVSMVRERVNASEGAPRVLAAETPRERALARLVLEDLLEVEPYDPEGAFGARMFLFAEEVEPLLVAYAGSDAPPLRRNATAALTRLSTLSAVDALARIAARTEDPVVLVRALAGIGRFRGRLDLAPLVARLERTRDRVEEAALLGALGRAGAVEAVPAFLRVGRRAFEARNSERLLPALQALARTPLDAHAEEVLDLVEDVERAARGRARTFRAPGVRGPEPPDFPDAPGARAAMLRQLCLCVRARLAPQEPEVVKGLLELGGDAPPGAVRARSSTLGLVHAAVLPFYLDALGRVGEPAAPFLRSIASGGTEEELAVRALALLALPLPERGEVGEALAQNSNIELRLFALELLLADVHARSIDLAREVLASFASEGPIGPGQRQLLRFAVLELSERERVSTAELLPLVRLAKTARSAHDRLPDEVRELTRSLVSEAATGAQRHELERAADELVALVVRLRLNPLLGEAERGDAREHVLGQVASVRAHRSDPGYLALVVDTVTAYLLGYASQERDPNHAEFAPPVPLEEEILLALGRTRSAQAAEVLSQFLGNRRNRHRAVACLALAMTGRSERARELAPYLLDEEPFARFCAAEGLRHLTGRPHGIDWLLAPTDERVRAAEETWRWLIDNGY